MQQNKQAYDKWVADLKAKGTTPEAEAQKSYYNSLSKSEKRAYDLKTKREARIQGIKDKREQRIEGNGTGAAPGLAAPK